MKIQTTTPVAGGWLTLDILRLTDRLGASPRRRTEALGKKDHGSDKRITGYSLLRIDWNLSSSGA